jgi:hypothetical protein
MEVRPINPFPSEEGGARHTPGEGPRISNGSAAAVGAG